MEAMVFFRQFVFFLILKLFNIFQKYSIKVIQALNFQPKPRHSIRRKYERFRVIFPLITIFRFLIFVLIIASLALLGVHSLDSARGSAAVRGLEAEVDVLLRVEAHDEGGDVDELLAHPDVTLADQNASVVDRLGKSELEDLSLQTTFQKIFNTKTQNVIQLHFGLVQHANTHQTTEERITFEEPSRMLLLKGEQNSGRFFLTVFMPSEFALFAWSRAISSSLMSPSSFFFTLKASHLAFCSASRLAFRESIARSCPC